MPQHESMQQTPVDVTKTASFNGRQFCVDLGDILVGQYEIRRILGTGHLGTVFAAWDQNRMSEVALKVISPDFLSNEQTVSRFLKAIQLAQQLSHPGIVNVFDVHRHDDFYFVTMELLEGQTLRNVIEVSQNLGQVFSIQEVLDIAKQVCPALAAAHKITTHKGLNPENIFVTESGEAKLMDFGFSALMEPGNMSVTGTGIRSRAVYYIAPELLKGGSEEEARSGPILCCCHFV